jgi:hypothetical protein
MKKSGYAVYKAAYAKFLRAVKPRFFLMVKMRKPSASTLGYVIKILMIIKLAISIIIQLLLT